jgi:transposase
MKQEHLKPLLESWSLDITIWDGAGVHRGHSLTELPGQRIIQPAYSPELNPAERVFQEIRRAIEGIVYPSLLDKRHAVDDFLTTLAADPDRIKRLCFWDWIQTSLCVS